MEDPHALVQQGLAAFRCGQYLPAAELLERAVSLQPDLLPSVNVMISHAYLLGARWDKITGYLPKNTNSLLAGGWLNSLANSAPVSADGTPIPWYTYPAIEFLEDKTDPNWSVFEWGCGYSSLWWAKRVKRLLSIEDDPTWHGIISARLPANAELRLEPDQARYVSALADSGEPFDVIVVDGSHRTACVQAVIQQAAQQAVLIYDNTDNTETVSAMEALAAAGWHRIDFYGLIPSYTYKNCTSIYFRDPSFLDRGQLPSQKISCVGPTCAQAEQQAM